MDRGDLRTRTFEESATAAESGAAECRRRLAQLRDPAASADVGVSAAARAQDRLVVARDRAVAAERRLAEAVRNHEAMTALRRMGAHGAAPAAQLPPLLSDTAPATRTGAQLVAWVHGADVAPADLWWEFVSLGGSADFLEFDAYLNGAWTMSGRDRAILEQVCWEYDSFRTPGEP